jgi:hypothetical protein
VPIEALLLLCHNLLATLSGHASATLFLYPRCVASFTVLAPICMQHTRLCHSLTTPLLCWCFVVCYCC